MRKKRALLFFSSLILFLGLSVALDRVLGRFISHPALEGLIFPPNAKRRFQTMEFSFNLQTNSLGFRDREFDSGRRARTRILALGDSFTYGWGVEIEQSWPKVMESGLRAEGRDVEVANLGKPGGSPKDYADIAEKAVPILKPDLIIVAVLQGDDLAQMEQAAQARVTEDDKHETVSVPETPRQRLSFVALRLYPNLCRLMSERVKPQPTLDYKWKEDAKVFLRVMTPESRARFEKLDAQIKSAFINGELNPALVYLGVIKPDYFLQTLDVNSPTVKGLIAEMAKQLQRIKKVALENNAAVLVVSVPYGAYVSRSGFRSRRRLGFNVIPEMLTTTAEDDAIESACRMAGLQFYEVTGKFRQFADARELFFDLDGHFNTAGHKLFAEAVSSLIEKRIVVE